MYAPIFHDQGGNAFLLAYKDILAETVQGAQDIGERLEDATGVQYGFSFSGETQDMQTVRAVEAKIKDLKVVVISGPLFEKAVELDKGSRNE
jgi:hypothetical protein